MSHFATLSWVEIKALAEFAGLVVIPGPNPEPVVSIWIDGTGMHAGTDGALVYRQFCVTPRAIPTHNK